MSYVRFNDQHDDGQLSQFRDRLSTEVRAQAGEDFKIFQDRNDIAWGQSWQEVINEALDTVMLLIVIITPSLFRSPNCRDEIARFLDRERRLRRTDLILPVYYIGAREMDDPALRDADEIARVLWTRQYADWRDLRFEAFTSPVVRKAIAQLAIRMRDAYWQSAGPPPVVPLRETSRARSVAQTEQVDPVFATTGSAKAEPPTYVVDQLERGDFATIRAALKAAKPGGRILVRPGLYKEKRLIIDKPLEILGDGKAEDIIVEASGSSVFLFKANFGRIGNLTLRQVDPAIWAYCVDITQGRLEMEGCDIVNASHAGVAIHNAADPRLAGNTIHDTKGSGVFVYDGGLGRLEDNDIFATGVAGVDITSGGNPTVRRNTIHDSLQAGVIVYDGGLGMLEDNDIFANKNPGIEIWSSGNPVVRHNKIRNGKASGVTVRDSGLGTLADNDIIGNAGSGIRIKSGGSPTVRGNRINRNEYKAIWIAQGSAGVIEDNDLTGNAQGAWEIAEDCEKNVTRARNTE